MSKKFTKLQKEGLHTGADLAPLGRSEVEVIEEKKQIYHSSTRESWPRRFLCWHGSPDKEPS